MGNVIKGLSGMLKFDPSINHIKKVTTLLTLKTESNENKDEEIQQTREG